MNLVLDWTEIIFLAIEVEHTSPCVKPKRESYLKSIKWCGIKHPKAVIERVRNISCETSNI